LASKSENELKLFGQSQDTWFALMEYIWGWPAVCQ